jgi:hypothetical protein
MRRRKFGMCLAAAAAVGAAITVPAAPAAAVPSGTGWSASWNYYNSAAYEMHLTIPGGRIDGYGPDINGIRRFDGVVQDTDGRDRACVRMRVIATDTGSLGSATACNGGSEVVNTTEFSEALFVHIDLMVNGAIIKSFFSFIPSSTGDSGLRTVGTGTEWAYTSSTDFHAEVHRPGVVVIGDGANQIADTRSFGGAVAHEGADDGCVVGAAADPSILIGDWTCEPGDVPGFYTFDFVEYIKVTGCYVPLAGTTRCLTMHMPEPH